MKKVYSLSLAEFLRYLKTIDYGYKDAEGTVHTEESYDLEKYPYSFSSPSEVIKNNCAWCWDICELIRDYCRHNGITVTTWFFEYRDDMIHQTHTQAFIELDKLWYPVPDNSDPHSFDEFKGKRYEEVTEEFQGYFREYIQYVSHNNVDNSKFVFKEYAGIFEEGLSDEQVLKLLREG